MERIYQLTGRLSVLLGQELCALTFDKGDAQQRFVTALYASTLELAGDALIMAQHARYSGVPILIRSMLEAHIHMRALVNNPNYYNRMLATLHYEDARMCTNALTLNESISASAGTVAELEARRDKSMADLKELKAKGYPRIDIKDTFVLAGRSNWYSPIYTTLCAHSHNNLHVVAHRHFEIRGDTYNPVFEREWTDDEIVQFLANLGMIIMDAHSAIAAFFKITETDEIKNTWAEIVAQIAKRQDA